MNAYWFDAGKVVTCRDYETGYREEEQAVYGITFSRLKDMCLAF